MITLKRGHDLPNQARLEGTVPVVSSSGITGFHNTAMARSPGVVTGRYGTLGQVFFLEEDFWPLNTSLYVSDFKGNSPRFISFFLRNVLRDYQSDKAAVPGVDRKVLHRLEVRLPDFETQVRIEESLARYDDLIENNQRRMQLFEQATRMLYDEWFVRFRFPGYEHTGVVDGLPKGWHRAALADLCITDGIQTGPFGSQLHQADYADEGVPVVMPKDLIGFRIAVGTIARIPEWLADKLSRHRMRTGDTVYGRRGDIGRRAFISTRHAGWICGTGCLRIRPNAEAVSPTYLFDSLGSPETSGLIANRAKGATMLSLNSSVLKSVPITVAPRDLQNKYVGHSGSMLTMIEVLADLNEKLSAAKELLLPRLVSGTLQVSPPNPSGRVY